VVIDTGAVTGVKIGARRGDARVPLSQG